MPDLEIHRFVPDDTDDVRTAFEITNTVAAADSPWEHPWLTGRFQVFLERGWDGEPPVCYLASVEGRAVGTAFVFYSERDNTHLAWTWLAVLPEHRRKGYGSSLFEFLVEEIRAAGRTSIGTDGWESERALGFAARFGLEKKSQAIMRRQHLAELERHEIQKLYDEAAERGRGLRAGPHRRAHARAPGERDGGAGLRHQRRPHRRPRHRGRGLHPRAAGRLRGGRDGPRQPALPPRGPAPRDRCVGRAHSHRRRGTAADHRGPARHRRRPGAPRPPARAAAEGRDAAVAGRGRAGARDRRHLERRVQRPHDRGQRGARLPHHGAGAAVPEVAHRRQRG